MREPAAICGRPGGLAPVVDRRSGPDRETGNRWEFPDLALLPQNRTKLEDLRGWAGWVDGGVLRLSDHLAAIVDREGYSVIAAKRRERGHHSVLPEKRQADQVVAKTAKVLS